MSVISSISDSQQFTWSGGSKIITLHTTNANVLVFKKVRQAKLENLYLTKKDSAHFWNKLQTQAVINDFWYGIIDENEHLGMGNIYIQDNNHFHYTNLSNMIIITLPDFNNIM